MSRRAVVAAPVAASAAALVPAVAREPGLPWVTPLPSQVVHEGYGVCQHVNFQTTVYQHQAEVMERYGQMAIAQMRSMYPPKLRSFSAAIAGARQYGVKWNAIVATMATGRSEIEQKIAHMAANNPEVIGSVEGVNEPNEGSGWVGPCLDRQRWIHDAVRSHPELDHVTILGPSMHDVRLAASGGAHWKQLADAGIADYMDVCSVHNYPAASVPDAKRAERVQMVYDAFGDGYPIKFSEWGYTNSLGGTRGSRVGGARPISKDAAASYDCQAVLDFANHGWQVMRYEFLDDPDPTNRVTESNYGLWEVQSVAGDPDTTWTPKPVVKPLTAMLRALRDPGGPYTTTPRQLRVDAPSDVRSCVTQKRDGSTTLWLWRHVLTWDPRTERSLSPGPVTARIERPRRTSTVEVGPMPVALPLEAATP
ncbi:hypothetical protein [Nocardioides sp.]|uniref:hypothetical protein n=1 Tax=Nocardioides sp. TaxID=35761 RepID=UPI002ED6442E